MNTELFPLKSEKASSKDLRRILTAYLRYWYLFAVGLVLSVVIAFLCIKYVITPKYEVNSTLLVRESAVVPDLSSVASFNRGEVTKSAISPSNVILLLKSRELMYQVVNTLNLTTTYYLEKPVRNVELYGATNPIKIIVTKLDSTLLDESFGIKFESGNTFTLTDHTGQTSSHKFGKEIKKPYGLFTIVRTSASINKDEENFIIQFNNADKVVRQYAEALSVVPVTPESSVLQLSLDDALPQKGEDVLNKMLELYTKESLEEKSYAINNTISFLDDRLKYITGNLSKVEREVEQYKRSNELTDVSTQASNYVEQANTYNKNMSDWAIQIEVLESIEQYLTDNPGQFKLIPSTLGIQDPTLMSLITKMNELQTERERLLRGVKGNNPLVLNLNEQLANLRLNTLENLKNIKNGLIITSNNYKANSERFRSKIGKIPTIERDLIEINRQQSIKQSIYSYLLQKREESSMAKVAIVPDYEIVDAAYSTNFPVSPNKMIIYLVAAILGLGIPFVYVFAKELLNDKIQSWDDLEKLTSIPVLDELPHYSPNKMIAAPSSQHPIVEKLGLIRAKLLFTHFNQDSKVVLVTSTVSGEGKTFLSINLAQTLALTDKKVLLLELDLRKPNLHKILGLHLHPGVSEYLTSDIVFINDIVQYTTKITNLAVITAGSIPDNSAELLMSDKLAYLIDQLKASFDYIIVDSSPIGQVADIFSINQQVDHTIFVTRADYTAQQSVVSFDDNYRSGMIVNPLILLNDVSVDNEHGYGYARDKNYLKKNKSAYN